MSSRATRQTNQNLNCLYIFIYIQVSMKYDEVYITSTVNWTDYKWNWISKRDVEKKNHLAGSSENTYFVYIYVFVYLVYNVQCTTWCNVYKTYIIWIEKYKSIAYIIIWCIIYTLYSVYIIKNNPTLVIFPSQFYYISQAISRRI